ncbi:MAG: hypothetical protein NZ802_09310 [Candidatus Poseidoniales archaeon]|nr:hypothetical protein [Candidatus Poseidoniales archaeon]
MKAELGGAFVLSWIVFGGGMNLGGLTGAVALAVTWMAFSGAHLLPVVTWSHIMTGDLSDTEGNWMANGMRLVAQVVGGTLGVVMVSQGMEAGTDWVAAEEMWITNVADNVWQILGMVAAGAVWWQVHTRCDSAWASAFGMMMLGGAMVAVGAADDMGNSLAGALDGIAETAVNWICMGLVVGIGARVGCEIDGLIGEEE